MAARVAYEWAAMTDEQPPKSPTSALPPGHPPRPFRPASACLLVNLGSPSGTDYWSVRRYLKEFLSDRRVIEVPRPLWWLILNLLRPDHPAVEDPAMPIRSSGTRSGTRRRSITITRAQAEKLAAALAGDGVIVDWAMRYGKPSIAARLAALKEQGCDRILIAPLYPQYAAATTATVNDKAFAALANDALAAGGPHAAALSRRSGLYRRARRIDRGVARRPATSSRRWCSPPSTACRGTISTRATPIIASARRRRGCCASGSAGRRRSSASSSSRASAGPNGCSPIPT